MTDELYFPALSVGDQLSRTLATVHQLLEMTKQKNWPQRNENGSISYDPEFGKLGFQVANQYERPTEFLQCVLDLIRCEFEPCPLGTTMLNSNLNYALNGLGDAPYQVGYLSAVSGEDQPFAAFWEQQLAPRLNELGYSLDEAVCTLVVCTTGEKRHDFEFLSEVNGFLGPSLSADQVISKLQTALDEDPNPRGSMEVGYCLDPALKDRVRVSVLLFKSLIRPNW